MKEGASQNWSGLVHIPGPSDGRHRSNSVPGLPCNTFQGLFYFAELPQDSCLYLRNLFLCWLMILYFNFSMIYHTTNLLEILDNTSKSLWELSNMEVSEKYMKCMKDSMAFSWNRTCLKMVIFTFLCARSHFLIKFQWSCLSFSLLVDVFFLKLIILCYKNELWQLMISPWVMSADQQSHA